MKLFLRPCEQFYGNSMAASRVLLFSTQALTSAITPLKSTIMRAGYPNASVIPILEKWVEQDRESKYSQLHEIIKDLSSTGHFKHSLEMLQWMGDKGGYGLSPRAYVVQLELVSSAHDIEEVERYFNAIPDNMRGYDVYCALLKCYADHGCSEEAEATMQKIREFEFGFRKYALPYNVMLEFYSATREESFYSKIQMTPKEYMEDAASKIKLLVEEMREEDIDFDKTTYDILLKFYSENKFIWEMEPEEYMRHAASKIELLVEEMREEDIDFDKTTYDILLKFYSENKFILEMENLWWQMKANHSIVTDWSDEFLAAQGYWNANQVEKCLTMLKKSEESMEEGNLNDFYVSMIKSFGEKGDMDGAERVWAAWLSNKKKMDFLIPQAMISGYGRIRQWEKAESIVFRMSESGTEPDAITSYYLADIYVKHDQMDKAVEALKKAISVSKPGWMPYPSATLKCFKYLKRQGDDAAKKELYNMLKERCGVPTWLTDDCLK